MKIYFIHNIASAVMCPFRGGALNASGPPRQARRTYFRAATITYDIARFY